MPGRNRIWRPRSFVRWVNIYAAGQSGSHPRPCSLLDDMHAPTNVYKTRQTTWRVRGYSGVGGIGWYTVKDRTEADSYRKQLVDRAWHSYPEPTVLRSDNRNNTSHKVQYTCTDKNAQSQKPGSDPIQKVRRIVRNSARV